MNAFFILRPGNPKRIVKMKPFDESDGHRSYKCGLSVKSLYVCDELSTLNQDLLSDRFDHEWAISPLKYFQCEKGYNV
jgi:hypothetical protein